MNKIFKDSLFYQGVMCKREIKKGFCVRDGRELELIISLGYRTNNAGYTEGCVGQYKYLVVTRGGQHYTVNDAGEHNSNAGESDFDILVREKKTYRVSGYRNVSYNYVEDFEATSEEGAEELMEEFLDNVDSSYPCEEEDLIDTGIDECDEVVQ